MVAGSPRGRQRSGTHTPRMRLFLLSFAMMSERREDRSGAEPNAQSELPKMDCMTSIGQRVRTS